MKKRLKQLGERLDALSLRERGLVLGAIIAVMFMAWDNLLMQPVYQKQKTADAAITQHQATINRLAQALQDATARGGSSPNQRLARERDALRAQIDILDHQLEAETANVIPPNQMATVLQEVLRRQQALKLVEVRSLPPESIFAGNVNASSGIQAVVYRHGLVMVLEGSYMELLKYLREIEGLPYAFVWDRLDVETMEYPRNRIVIRIYTLSLSEGLIGA